jgi:hypothetical protein
MLSLPVRKTKWFPSDSPYCVSELSTNSANVIKIPSILDSCRKMQNYPAY